MTCQAINNLSEGRRWSGLTKIKGKGGMIPIEWIGGNGSEARFVGHGGEEYCLEWDRGERVNFTYSRGSASLLRWGRGAPRGR